MPSDNVLNRIEKPESLDDVVYRQIKEAILDVTLPPGVPLSETGLAEDLGVSRTPVSRALVRLAQEGFAVAASSKGYQVAEIPLEEIQEINDLREILECYLIRETARQFTKEEMDELEAVLQVADEALEREDYAGFIATNRMFHHFFDRKYGNQRLSALLATLDEHVYRHLMANLQPVTRIDLVARYDEHRAILAAIRAGDVEAAVAIMRDHLRFFDNK